MVLEKIKEIYAEGSLAAELFRKDYFSAIISHGHVAMKNRHYSSAQKGVEDRITLEKDDFDAVLDAISCWRSEKDSLWGRIPHGHSWCGYLGSEYFAPDSKRGVYVKKDEKADFKVGETEKRIKIGRLEFILERFRFEIRRGNEQAVFDEWQLPLIKESFELYEKRSDLYLPGANNDDCADCLDSF